LPPGLFVTFEGGDGAGKSTQLLAIAERARAGDTEVVTCREPGGTPLGERLREALFGLEIAPEPLTELLTFEAARAELAATVIRPALEREALVLCDRFADSTVAYQGYGRGLDVQMIRALNQVATGGLAPDRTVLLDVSPEAGRGRNSKGATDYLEREVLEFHNRVREGFLTLARTEPERWLVIDGTQSQEAISEEVWRRISPLLKS
jgi:dTMP kinase